MAVNDNSPAIVKVIEYFRNNYDFRRNVVTNDIEYKRKDQQDYTEINENNLYIELRKDGGIRASISDVMVFLGSDYIERYNPFETYFDSISDLYDPELHGDYIKLFAEYVKAKYQERFNLQLKKWMVRAVICALVPDYFNKQAFILVSEQQNTGKTTFSRFLVPKVLKRYFIENISIDKDSLIALSSNFIGILDELSTLSKFEINALKSVMSKLLVNVRHPYERRAKMTPRRISFFGSTNMTEFLTDDANVRWLCFEIESIDWKYRENIDIDIVWSQAYQLWKTGFKYEMTREEIQENEMANEDFRVVTVEMELLQKYFRPGTAQENDGAFMASELMNEIQIKSCLKLSQKEFGRALKRIGFVPTQTRQHRSKETGDRLGYPVKVYYVKQNT